MQISAKNVISDDFAFIITACAVAMCMEFCASDIAVPLFSIITMLGMVIIGALIVRALYRMQFNPFTIVPMVTILWYAGPMSYYCFIGEQDKTSVLLLDPATTYNLTAIATVVGVICYGIGLIFPRKFIDLSFLFKNNLNGILIYAAGFSVVQAYLILTNQWVYGIVAMGSGVEKSPLVLFFAGMAHGIFPAIGLFIGTQVRNRKLSYLHISILAFVILIQLYWAFVGGRREMIFPLALFSLFTIIGFKQGEPIIRKELMTYAAVGLVALMALNVGGKLYYAIRVASFSTGNKSISFSEMASALTSTDTRVSDAGYADNLISRPFIINSVAVVETTHSGYLWGKLMLTQIQVPIPKQIWPSKDASTLIPEWDWNQYLGVPFTDWANTTYLGGYTDYGYAGFPIYLAIIMLLQMFVLSAARYLKLTSAYVFLAASLVTNLIQAEEDFAVYTVWVRDGVLYLGICWTLAWGFGKIYGGSSGMKGVQSFRKLPLRLPNKPRLPNRAA